MMRMIDAVRPNRPEFSFLTGWDAVLVPMLLIGCDGGTNATSGVVPELTRKLYDLTVDGRLAEARRIQADLIEFFDPMLYSADFPEGFRVAVQMRGFQMGVGRQPLSERHRTILGELEKTLGAWLARQGLAAASPPPATPALDPQQIRAIVESVVAELKQRERCEIGSRRPTDGNAQHPAKQRPTAYLELTRRSR